MTDSSNSSDRLSRIERILEATALRADANTRAIEALRTAQEADRIQLREGITDAIAMLTSIAEEAAEEREAMKQQQAEADQRFEILLAEIRADRERNDREHEAFRQAIRGLLEKQEDA